MVQDDTPLDERGFSDIPSHPNQSIGFEIQPREPEWTFTPEYYPDRFTQNKDRELKRDGRQCGGEDVSVKKTKNREFHVTGVILAGEVPVFQKLMDYQGSLDLLSPLTPAGGQEVIIKDSELGKIAGYDGLLHQWRFNYTIDLVSTGRDEYDRDDDENVIVSSII